MIKHISVIVYKQLLDTIKNPLILLLFLMFPIISFVFYLIFAENEFRVACPSFITMHLVLSPIIVASSIVAEDREKGTLRYLLMSGIKPIEYIISIILYVLVANIFSYLIFIPIIAQYEMFQPSIRFFMVAILISTISIILGIIIAILSKNQISTTPIATIVAFIIGMFPMFANVNEKISNYTYLVYSTSISKLITDSNYVLTSSEITCLFISLIAAFILFIIAFKIKKYFGL